MAFRAMRSITDADVSRILGFIKETVSTAHAEGAVVGISGGIDSAVVVKLCADALGADKVHAIFMPVSSTPKEDYRQTESMRSTVDESPKSSAYTSICADAVYWVFPVQGLIPAFFAA